MNIRELYKTAAQLQNDLTDSEGYDNFIKRSEFEEEVKKLILALIPGFKIIARKRIFLKSRDIVQDVQDIVQEALIAICCGKMKIIKASENLFELPNEVKFPECLDEKIYYDDTRHVLLFTGIMTDEEKEMLLSLSDNKHYCRTIVRLYEGFSRYVHGILNNKIYDYFRRLKNLPVIQSIDE